MSVVGTSGYSGQLGPPIFDGQRLSLLERLYVGWYTTTFRRSAPGEVRGILVASFLSRYLKTMRLGTRRVAAALDLIAERDPRRLARMQRDVAGIFVTAAADAGSFLKPAQLCLLRADIVLQPGFTREQLALVLVHEAMHARLYRMGYGRTTAVLKREEVICTRAELAFAERLAEPERSWYIARCRESLARAIAVAAG